MMKGVFVAFVVFVSVATAFQVRCRYERYSDEMPGRCHVWPPELLSAVRKCANATVLPCYVKKFMKVFDYEECTDQGNDRNILFQIMEEEEMTSCIWREMGLLDPDDTLNATKAEIFVRNWELVKFAGDFIDSEWEVDYFRYCLEKAKQRNYTMTSEKMASLDEHPLNARRNMYVFICGMQTVGWKFQVCYDAECRKIVKEKGDVQFPDGDEYW